MILNMRDVRGMLAKEHHKHRPPNRKARRIPDLAIQIGHGEPGNARTKRQAKRRNRHGALITLRTRRPNAG